MIAKSEILLDGLAQRRDYVNNKIDYYVSNRNQIVGERPLIEIANEIAYFIHFIKRNESLNLNYNELLFYLDEYKKSQEFKVFVDKVYSQVEIICNGFYFHYFTDDAIKTGSLWNPFKGGRLSHDQIAVELQNKENYSLIDSGTLDNLIAVTWDLLESIDWKKYPIGRNKDLFEAHHELDRLKSELLTVEKFHCNFIGYQEAHLLQKFYYAVRDDLTLGDDFLDKDVEEVIKSGKYSQSYPPERLKESVNKVFDYLKQSLQFAHSIRSEIVRFRNYFMLYKYDLEIPTSKPEIFFQRQFEEYMFLQGHYPLSQIHLGKGIPDDVVINVNSAFLFEIKQIGFGKKKIVTSSIDSDIKKAVIQAKDYHSKLQLVPFAALSKEVYIIIFTKVPIRYSEKSNMVTRLGIDFIFEFVNLSDTPTSKQDPREISLESYFADGGEEL